MLPLRYRPLWTFASCVIVLAVIWTSLQVSFPTSPSKGIDKIEHFATYCALALWFTGIMPREAWWRVVVGLLVLGLSIELAQWWMHVGRKGDPFDVVANTGGVFAGVPVAMHYTGGWATRFEAWLA